MICLAARLPLLQFGDHEIASYEARWIEQSIRKAAAEAGHDSWFFARDVAQGVIEYLTERFPGSRITLPDLVEKISLTLDSIGFPDIAAHLKIAPPPVEISLSDIARRADSGFELRFFHMLDVRIREVTAAGVEKVKLTGFVSCASKILGAARPDAALEGFRDEVVALLRFRALPGTSSNTRRFQFVIK